MFAKNFITAPLSSYGSSQKAMARMIDDAQRNNNNGGPQQCYLFWNTNNSITAREIGAINQVTDEDLRLLRMHLGASTIKNIFLENNL